MLYTGSFFGCCGATIIYHFGGANGSPWHGSPQEARRDIQQIQDDHRDRAMLLVALTAKQKERFEDVLEECGFQHVGYGDNAPHRSQNHLFVWFRKKRKYKKATKKDVADYWNEQKAEK